MKPIRCRRVRALLSRYIDRELGQELIPEIRYHLSACTSCQSIAHQLQQLTNEARNLEYLQPPPGLFEQAYAACHDEPLPSAWNRYWLIVAPVSGLTVLVGIVLVFLGPLASKETRQIVRPLPADIQLMNTVAKEFRRAEVHYQRAIEQLRRMAKEDIHQWAPDRRQLYLSSLPTIDEAVERFRNAAQAEPVDPRIQEMLFAVYRRQINFLENTILTNGGIWGQGQPVAGAAP